MTTGLLLATVLSAAPEGCCSPGTTWFDSTMTTPEMWCCRHGVPADMPCTGVWATCAASHGGTTGATGPAGGTGATGGIGATGSIGIGIDGAIGATGATGPAGSGGTCLSYWLWTSCANTGVAACTVDADGCTALVNVGAVAAHGPAVAVDFDTMTHCALRYWGKMSGTQAGTVTVKLRDYTGTDADRIATTWSSGTTCVSRSSAVADLSALTGVHVVGLQFGSSTTADDPSLTGIVLTCCSASFTW